jgi:hypothetical protein
MHDMAMGLTSWWNPLLLGLPIEHTGWLHHWLGAAFIGLWPEQAQMMAKIPFMGLLLVTLVGTWWSVYHLARLPAAKGKAHGFGAQRRALDGAGIVSGPTGGRCLGKTPNALQQLGAPCQSRCQALAMGGGSVGAGLGLGLVLWPVSLARFVIFEQP